MAKVLVIEDDQLMSRMYQKIFTFEHYEVELAGNGQEGLEKVKTFQPTLILLDVMMPVMNGLETLDKLKADPTTKGIPVIMLTNLAGQQDAETALSKGAVKYIIKSEHDPKQVSDMVKEVLAGYTRNELPSTSAATPSAPAPEAPATPVAPVAPDVPIAPVAPAPPTETPTAPPAV